MELRINIVEAAAELAEQRVIEEYGREKNLEWYREIDKAKIDSFVYDEDTEGMSFTEEAQEIFNGYYDQIYSKLIDCKTQELSDSTTKQVNAKGLVEKLAHEDVKKYFDTVYSGYPPEKISDMIWELGELNDLRYTLYAQRVYNAAEEKFLMHLMEFEL